MDVSTYSSLSHAVCNPAEWLWVLLLQHTVSLVLRICLQLACFALVWRILTARHWTAPPFTSCDNGTFQLCLGVKRRGQSTNHADSSLRWNNDANLKNKEHTGFLSPQTAANHVHSMLIKDIQTSTGLCAFPYTFTMTSAQLSVGVTDILGFWYVSFCFVFSLKLALYLMAGWLHFARTWNGFSSWLCKFGQASPRASSIV